jgi:NAD(P)-dependent dehydrogenase (short-subunit alcohol dehydrogenase family)
VAEPSRPAVVTGAGSGLGRAIASALADDGWSVALPGRTRAALDGTAAAGGTILSRPSSIVPPTSARLTPRWRKPARVTKQVTAQMLASSLFSLRPFHVVRRRSV